MAHVVLEVPEDQAQGKIKEYYDEIRTIFHLPFVSAAFRALAVQPDFLQLSWSALKPNVQTLYFEHIADEIRALATDAAASSANTRDISVPSDAVHTVSILHYATSKVFFSIAALRWATTGQQPVLVMLPRDAKRQTVPGVPKELDGWTPPDVSPPTWQAGNSLQDADNYLGSPDLQGDYTFLWQWGEQLRPAWDIWWKHTREVGEHTVPRSLAALADSGITSLPFRMDISPHTLRHAGLSELELDALRSRLNQLHQSLARQMAWVAFLAVAIQGRDRARQSSFPPQAR